MRKTMLALVIATAIMTLLLVAGCIQMKYYVCEDGSQVTNPDLCIKETSAPESESTEEVPEEIIPIVQEIPATPIKDKQLSTEAKALFEKSDKATGLQFNYVASPDIMPKNTYYCSRQRMKVVLETKDKFTDESAYDTIYLDLVNKVASAYCEELSYAVCRSPNKKFDVDFNKYYVRNPFEWIDIVTKADLTGKSKTVDRREVKEMAFEIDGKQGTMYVESYYGVPVSVNFEGVQHDYLKMIINQVKPDDLYHPIMPE